LTNSGDTFVYARSADALLDADVKTLVLETGSLLFQTHIDNLPGHTFNFGASQEHGVSHYINKPGTSSNLVNTVQMNLGGRSVFGEGLIPRMDDWEINHWPTRIRQYLTTHSGYADAEQLVRKRRTLGPFQELLIGELTKELTDDEVIALATKSTDKTFATMKFLFDSPLNDKNYISYRVSGQKLEVFVEPNMSGLPFQGEVEALRNRVFTFLQATYDPNKKMDYLYNGSVHHAGGSLRMSSDHTGVVDDNLKFEAYDNLYCCDVSVFPRIPTANPCLTLVALAQRLAAHLKGSP
jgi:hypothetical protein